jgi:hypothetical protein
LEQGHASSGSKAKVVGRRFSKLSLTIEREDFLFDLLVRPGGLFIDLIQLYFFFFVVTFS